MRGSSRPSRSVKTPRTPPASPSWLTRTWLTRNPDAFFTRISANFSALWVDFYVSRIPLNMFAVRGLTMKCAMPRAPASWAHQKLLCGINMLQSNARALNSRKELFPIIAPKRKTLAKALAHEADLHIVPPPSGLRLNGSGWLFPQGRQAVARERPRSRVSALLKILHAFPRLDGGSAPDFVRPLERPICHFTSIPFLRARMLRRSK